MEDLVDVFVDSREVNRDMVSLIPAIMDMLCWIVVLKPCGRFVVSWVGIGSPLYCLLLDVVGGASGTVCSCTVPSVRSMRVFTYDLVVASIRG